LFVSVRVCLLFDCLLLCPRFLETWRGVGGHARMLVRVCVHAWFHCALACSLTTSLRGWHLGLFVLGCCFHVGVSASLFVPVCPSVYLR
jgi:hypothetical protein